MAIFQKSVINKFLANLDQNEVSAAYKKFTEFYGDTERIENIKLLKEENYQEGFLREIFVQVLGYTINPDKNYNLTTEFKNETDSKKADGAILKDTNAIGVIELKSTKTVNLESITTQAFNYKNYQSKCKYVITSNYEKLNFYIDNATEWEEFNLFTLTEKEFALFYLLLSAKNLLNDIPEKIKKESRLHEENISDKLYKDYSQFKHKIYNNLLKNNPQYEKLVLFKKSQKLLDRVLFILFAEDSGLVPPNAISRIVDQWKTFKELDEPVTLYSRFVKLFNHLDEGHTYKEYSLPAYNGGLFKTDEVLDNVNIDDDVLLDDILKLSSYDFNTEVDVNILGHIFEHSLTEIEELTAELEGTLVEREKTKRKKDGIFYTPKYITKYIVDNTIGALCDEKKKELNLYEIDLEVLENSKTTKGSLTAKAKKLFDNLDQYRNYILSLKILDPACGSGAFLNQALDFLINEHKWIDEHKASLLQEGFTISEFEKEIVENNIYGVDINEEAVEIAKLSLWLRTARKGRKLSTLSDNIKCGNSLIDDPEVAGDKAFNWNEDFKEIMQNGGFDVVIGNPPYGDYFNSREKEYILKVYEKSFSGTYDIYISFFELSAKILKSKRFLSFIVPNTFLNYSQFYALRQLLIETGRICSIIQLKNIFRDAIVDNAIIVIRKDDMNVDVFLGKIYNDAEELDITLFEKLPYILLSKNEFKIRNFKGIVVDNLFNNAIKLGELVKITQGITTGGNDCFLMNETEKIKSNLVPVLFKKSLKGQDIFRYSIKFDDLYILYSTKNLDNDNQKDIEQFLEPFKEKLSNKRETKNGTLPWYCLHWARDEDVFKNPKILIRQTAHKLIGVIDNENHYPIDTIHTLNFYDNYENNLVRYKFLLGILNSKLFEYLYSIKLDEIGKVYPQIKKINIEWMPIKNYDDNSRIPSLVDYLENKISEIYLLVNRFTHRLLINFNLENSSRVIDHFFEFSFKKFIDLLSKQKVELTLKQQDEWEEYFNEYKAQINNLQEEITKTDNQIDVMVYKLYNLTYQEVKIVDPDFWMSEEEYNYFEIGE